MSNIAVGKMYAVLIGALGVVGLFVSGHLFKLMNVDITIDILRIGLAAYLTYAAFVAKNEKMATNGLFVVGVLYIVMGIWGLFSPTLAGLLPSGLTGFDIAFHLVTGVAAGGVAARHMKARGTMAHA